MMTQRQFRAQVIMKMGGKCAQCHFAQWHILQIDHIDGGGDQERNHLSARKILRLALQDATRYQLLCPNCHALKTVARYPRCPLPTLLSPPSVSSLLIQEQLAIRWLLFECYYPLALSRWEIASACSVSSNTVYLWERGTHTPRPQAVKALRELHDKRRGETLEQTRMIEKIFPQYAIMHQNHEEI